MDATFLFGHNVYIGSAQVGYISPLHDGNAAIYMNNKKWAFLGGNGDIGINGKAVGYIDESGDVIMNDKVVGEITPQDDIRFFAI